MLSRPTARDPLYTEQTYRQGRPREWRRQRPSSVTEQLAQLRVEKSNYTTKRLGPLSWETTDEKAKKTYRQSIGSLNICSCPAGQKDICSHLAFVMIEALGLQEEDEMLFQRTWLDREVEEILEKMPKPEKRMMPKPQPRPTSSKPQTPQLLAAATTQNADAVMPPVESGLESAPVLDVLEEFVVHNTVPGSSTPPPIVKAPGASSSPPSRTQKPETSTAAAKAVKAVWTGESLSRLYPSRQMQPVSSQLVLPFLDQLRVSIAVRDPSSFLSPVDRLAALDALALDAHQKNDVDRALQLRAEAVPLARLVEPGIQSSSLSIALAKLADSYLCKAVRADQYTPSSKAMAICAQSVEHARAAVDAAGSNESLVVNARRVEGLALLRSEQHDQAVDCLNVAIRDCQKLPASTEQISMLSSLYQGLGRCYAGTTQYQKAMDAYVKALDLEMQAHGKKAGAERISDLFLDLARLHELQGALQEADDACEQAKRALLEGDVPPRLSRADAALLAGRICAKRGEGQEALQNLEAAENLYIQFGSGSSDARVIAARRERALLLVQERKYVDAGLLLIDVLAKEKEMYGAISANVAETEKVLGTLAMAQHKRADALSRYSRALKIWQTLPGFGSAHPKCIQIQALMETLKPNPKPPDQPAEAKK